MKNIAPETAATAAGISPAQFAEFEQNGKSGAKIDYDALGRAVQIDGKKLERLVGGWLPSAKDLGLWRELRVITSTTSNGMQVHCYLVWDEVTRDAALFDTGVQPELIFKIVEENGLNLKHLFITHGHYDHVDGLAAIRDKFPKFHLHTDQKGALPQHKNRRNDFIMLGSLRITNRETPGHAEDGITYVVGNWPEDASSVAIVGDAIFAGSMGGAKGLGDVARTHVREQIFTLPGDTLICPGHGPVTTVAEEKLNNPFF